MRARGDQRIFFPWERRGGLVRRLGLDRARPFLIGLGALAFVVCIGVREHRITGERQTRAILVVVGDTVERWMAEHEGSCPTNLAQVAEWANLKQSPRDAWGRPLRLNCPGRHAGSRYELSSDGADGQPGGLDRIE